MKKLSLLLTLFTSVVFSQKNVDFVCKTSFNPNSPAAIVNGDRVYFKFTYNISNPDGARIFIMPESNADISNVWYSGSKIYKGTGIDSMFFTIKNENAHVDSLSVRIVSPDESTTFNSFFIPVNYTFGSSMVSNVSFLQGSPISLLLGEKFTIKYNFKTNESGGIRVFMRPFSKGQLTPSYSALSSPLLSGSGIDTTNFTITSGTNVLVDSIKVTITNADQSKTIAQFFVPVRCSFSNSSVKITNNVPTSPALLNFENNVTTKFDYKTTVTNGVRIFIFPYTNGKPALNYGMSGSPTFKESGSASSNFTILESATVIDHLKVVITNVDQTETLLEYFFPVNYTFGNTQIYDIEFCPNSPASMATSKFVDVYYKYKTSETNGIRVFNTPMTAGSWSPSFATSPSAGMMPTGSGSGNLYFTITKGHVKVDQIEFQVTGVNTSDVLLKFYVPVNFEFKQEIVTSIESTNLDSDIEITSFPSPFSEHNTLNVPLKDSENLKINLLDGSGQFIKTIFEGMASTGLNSYNVDTENLPQGIYIYNIIGNNFNKTLKVTKAR